VTTFVKIQEFENWLKRQGKTPAEIVLKARLRQLLGASEVSGEIHPNLRPCSPPLSATMTTIAISMIISIMMTAIAARLRPLA